mgnify:CR=1 FL=1
MHAVTDHRPTSVVFDLGAVLIDWDPRYLYRSLFPGDEAGMERFLAAGGQTRDGETSDFEALLDAMEE